MSWIFTSPSLDDFIHLLRAWKFWVLGALAGALIGAAVYFIVPPEYRARATVNVDFNLEEAWPQDTDRQQFYYLERETRKLEEIAFSDEVLEAVSSEYQISVQELRDETLELSQPAEAGWHFYAQHPDPNIAREMAASWAQAFETKVQENVAASQGLNSYILVDATQTQDLPVERSRSLGTTLLLGATLLLTVSALFLLFFSRQG
jgi:capsular polysaccharide biosynthesis protein